MSLATLQQTDLSGLEDDIGIGTTLNKSFNIEFGSCSVKITRELVDAFYRYCSIQLHTLFIHDLVSLFRANQDRLYEISNKQTFYAWLCFLRFENIKRDCISKIEKWASDGIQLIEQDEPIPDERLNKYEKLQLIQLIISKQLRVEMEDDKIYLVSESDESIKRLRITENVEFWVALNHFIYFSQILHHDFWNSSEREVQNSSSMQS